ncbi:hypothetical protein ACTIVE_1663 [Actinomadura verrucosospora]|uniref:Uncharacterized protein n=1 Tax=Actinomadura verrucosospora TaxID=46165 RepID=A0A7D4A450_ACTVE|nr:hypothetical protein ACTIVE_1663 [Actinomadura verrucosospora]
MQPAGSCAVGHRRRQVPQGGRVEPLRVVRRCTLGRAGGDGRCTAACTAAGRPRPRITGCLNWKGNDGPDGIRLGDPEPGPARPPCEACMEASTTPLPARIAIHNRIRSARPQDVQGIIKARAMFPGEDDTCADRSDGKGLARGGQTAIWSPMTR